MGTKIKVLDAPGVEIEPMGMGVDNRPVYQVQRSQVRQLIRTLGKRGQIFTVSFRKKNGAARQMTGRFGCHKKAEELNKTGVNRDTTAHYPQYVKVMETTPGIRDLKGRFRAPECQFRTFNLDTLMVVRGAGRTFVVVGNPCYAAEAEPPISDREVDERGYVADRRARL